MENKKVWEYTTEHKSLDWKDKAHAMALKAIDERYEDCKDCHCVDDDTLDSIKDAISILERTVK